jgi:hypothetical protein
MFEKMSTQPFLLFSMSIIYVKMNIFITAYTSKSTYAFKLFFDMKKIIDYFPFFIEKELLERANISNYKI